MRAVSLATIEVKREGSRTRLELIEQALPSTAGNGGQREEGTKQWLDALGESLKKSLEGR